MIKPITAGTPVKFDSEHGPQEGVVSDILRDLSNGRKVAAVQVEGALDGRPWTIPLDQLARAACQV
ncbi:hypothetical protein [Rugamonas sp. DEMB1]|uniref:hypothetical protein n=1 Tax=Rugamonas sp. DEMB1 TaxID=3039386 RepID=UPI002446A3AB|nr:hypothetical protein [Rugamonas sp. DEMB1]WGG48954.1 hypothetical protein QC826_20215 [Rugamonas sp. DEMB1]